MTLEEQIRDAVAKGLTHLTLYPSLSEDGRTIYWSCRATPSARYGYVSFNAVDPIYAISATLKALPGAKARAKKATATVTEPEPPKAGNFDEWMK